MKRKYFIVVAMALTSVVMFAQTTSQAGKVQLPQIKQNGAVKQLFVDGKPFIMLSGELHNSSASSIEYMKPVWDNLAAMHLNTVVSTVNWELLEPEEGKFSFELVDAQIQEARKRDMRLVVIWFASWKNGGSNYAPMWVKTNPVRFPVQVRKAVPTGRGSIYVERDRTMPLSPLGEASMNAEAKAFRVLMRHIREVDPQHTVIMMQVDNEMGLLGDSRDRSMPAEAAWGKQVPSQLLNYFVKNKASLLPEMQEVWGRNGYKTSGTWTEVFGTDEWAEEVFMAWHYSVYINKVIEEGKAELNIPMYVNAWLGPQPGSVLPGDWPSGGPVARVMDVWRAGAPANDLLAPDIYVDDFKGVLAEYARSGNPLWIPEARDQTGNLFWALGNHSALGWAIFGIDDLNEKSQVANAYSILSEFLPQLAAWQAEGRVAGVLLQSGEENQVISLGGYKITISKPRQRGAAAETAPLTSTLGPGGVASASRAMPDDARPFGLVINTSPDEFLFIGSGFVPAFSADSREPEKVVIGWIDEGTYNNGKWVPGRRLNGDEGRPSLRAGSITMMKIKVFKIK
jgi:beta-galactosidase GanA